jgi:deoxycytidine triphosphate deaminase
MADKDALCEKIKEIYPDIGECGIDVKVDYDQENNAWVVDLKKDQHELKTFLESDDAETCMLGKQCIGLGIQIAQLKDNIMKT